MGPVGLRSLRKGPSASLRDKKEGPAPFFLPALFCPGKENELVLNSDFGMLSGSESGDCGITSSRGHVELFRGGFRREVGGALEAAPQ